MKIDRFFRVDNNIKLLCNRKNWTDGPNNSNRVKNLPWTRTVYCLRSKRSGRRDISSHQKGQRRPVRHDATGRSALTRLDQNGTHAARRRRCLRADDGAEGLLLWQRNDGDDDKHERTADEQWIIELSTHAPVIRFRTKRTCWRRRRRQYRGTARNQCGHHVRPKLSSSFGRFRSGHVEHRIIRFIVREISQRKHNIIFLIPFPIIKHRCSVFEPSRSHSGKPPVDGNEANRNHGHFFSTDSYSRESVRNFVEGSLRKASQSRSPFTSSLLTFWFKYDLKSKQTLFCQQPLLRGISEKNCTSVTRYYIRTRNQIIK